MATTLAQFYTEETARYGKWLARIGADRDAARTEQEEAKKGLDTATAALEAKTKEIAEKRARLPGTTIPAETEALVRDIAAQVVLQRRLATAVRDGRRRLAAVEAQTTALDAATRRLEPRVAELTAAAKRATDEAVIRTKWKTDAASPPVSDIVAQANAAKTGPLPQAQTKIDAIPQKLRDLAGARRTAAVALYTAATAERNAVEDARHDELQADPDSAADKLADARLTFQQAAAALGELATTAAVRLSRARAVLDALVAPGALAIPADEKAAATAGTVESDAEAQLSKETDYLKAVGDEIGTASALALATRALLADDPTVDPGHDASLDDERTAEGTALGKVTGARGPWTTNRRVIDRWTGILSDGTWRTLVSFLEAKATLDDLATKNPSQLVTDLNAAETALIAALESAGAAERRRIYLELESATTRAAVERLAESRDADLFLSLRSNP